MRKTVGELWDRHALPRLVELACRSHAILDERRRCVPQATGDVLEIGVGSGLNLSLYDAARVQSLEGIDVSEPLLARALARATRLSFPVGLVCAPAEALPYDAARFDSVVMTYTFCSVGDPAAVLGEIRRVMKPGGRLHFIEHGLAPDPSVQAWQRRVTPTWRRVGGNCHLDRDVKAALEKAGYEITRLRSAYAEEGLRLLSYTHEGEAR